MYRGIREPSNGTNTTSHDRSLNALPQTHLQAFEVFPRLAGVDRSGGEHAVPAPTRPYTGPKISPDGRRVAITVEELGRQVWIYDMTRDTLTRLTFEGNRNATPV